MSPTYSTHPWDASLPSAESSHGPNNMEPVLRLGAGVIGGSRRLRLGPHSTSSQTLSMTRLVECTWRITLEWTDLTSEEHLGDDSDSDSGVVGASWTSSWWTHDLRFHTFLPCWTHSSRGLALPCDIQLRTYGMRASHRPDTSGLRRGSLNYFMDIRGHVLCPSVRTCCVHTI